MKIALVYDRINKWGGAERLLLALHRIFPDAPIYTSLYDSKKTDWIGNIRVQPSWLQRIPGIARHHQKIPFLMPFAFESFDFSNFDVVISVTSAEAKGIVTRPETLHICYCLTPTRYLYSHSKDYLGSLAFPGIAQPILKVLKKWDQIAAWRPDGYAAISETVRQRIKKYYHQEAEVIYPPLTPISISHQPSAISHQPYYLLVSRLEPYKQVDLAISAFNKLKDRLVIVGRGSQEKKLKKLAGSTVIFTNELTEDRLFDYYKNCRALIMPQEEDFGLVALEAQSFYKPVIAYNRGGALETVADGKTGIFFDQPKVDSLIKAIRKFRNFKINKKYFEDNLSRFSFDRFKKGFTQYLNQQWHQFRKTK